MQQIKISCPPFCCLRAGSQRIDSDDIQPSALGKILLNLLRKIRVYEDAGGIGLARGLPNTGNVIALQAQRGLLDRPDLHQPEALRQGAEIVGKYHDLPSRKAIEAIAIFSGCRINLRNQCLGIAMETRLIRWPELRETIGKSVDEFSGGKRIKPQLRRRAAQLTCRFQQIKAQHPLGAIGFIKTAYRPRLSCTACQNEVGITQAIFDFRRNLKRIKGLACLNKPFDVNRTISDNPRDVGKGINSGKDIERLSRRRRRCARAGAVAPAGNTQQQESNRQAEKGAMRFKKRQGFPLCPPIPSGV